MIANLLTSILRTLPAETAHDLGMMALQRGYHRHFLPKQMPKPYPQLRQKIVGLGELLHPIGLAAGFDKQCIAPRAFTDLGFSFLEIGTVTPRPQPGNQKPRMFRLSDQRAIINRMGFNSDGATAVARRLQELRWNHDAVPLGINIGKNKETPNEHAIDDYLRGLEQFLTMARYIVVNVSSPNTPGLRSLQSEEFLSALAAAKPNDRHKIWIKLDPDQKKSEFQKTIASIAKHDFRGVILSNTHRVTWPEAGGLSGQPLANYANGLLEWAWEVHRGKLSMISSGGIFCGLDVFHRIARGACAVQLYSALVYRGPLVVWQILNELLLVMREAGVETLDDLRGSHYES